MVVNKPLLPLCRAVFACPYVRALRVRVYSITVTCQSADGPVDTHTPLCFRSLSRPLPLRPLSHFYFPPVNALQQSACLCQVYKIWLHHESCAATKSRPCIRSPFGAHSQWTTGGSRPTRWPGPRPPPTPWGAGEGGGADNGGGDGLESHGVLNVSCESQLIHPSWLNTKEQLSRPAFRPGGGR